MSDNYQTGGGEAFRRINADGVDSIEFVSSMIQFNQKGRILLPVETIKKIARLKLGETTVI